MKLKLHWALVCALALPSVVGGADEEAKNAARVKWARGVLADFWDAAISMDYESADGLLDTGLLESSNRERGKTNSFSGALVRKHELWQGRPEYKVTSEAVEPDGAEVILKGEVTNGSWKADFKARVAREGAGKWSIRYLVVKEREQPAKKSPK